MFAPETENLVFDLANAVLEEYVEQNETKWNKPTPLRSRSKKTLYQTDNKRLTPRNNPKNT